MSQLRCILAHPNLAASRANAALSARIRRLPGAEVIDLYARYGHKQTMDIEAEAQSLMAADAIVLQFPVQWYSTPSLLKEWQDQVLTQMMYVAPQTQGCRLAGKPVMVVATAGATFADYTPEGRNRVSVNDLLLPLQAMANRCGLRWLPPFVVYDTRNLGDEALAEAGESLVVHLAAHLEPQSEQAPVRAA
jgi:putative NADPH-quinone reductase